MASLASAFPVLPGKREALRRFTEEMGGARRSEYEASRRRLGITIERSYLQQTPQGDLVIVYTEADHPEQLLERIAASQDPFDVWFKQQLQEIHGVDFNQPPPGPPPELIFDQHVSLNRSSVWGVRAMRGQGVPCPGSSTRKTGAWWCDALRLL